MRVAIYEPSPRICGPVIWAQHVRQGFRDLGHECDIVSITKSGRPSARWDGETTEAYLYGFNWCGYKPDQMASVKQAKDLLDRYDLIVLTEPKCAPLDRDVYKRGIGEEPIYVTALKSTKTPWLSVLHGPQYDEKRAPLLGQVFAAGNFLGKLVTPHEGYIATGGDRFAGISFSTYPCLPYSLRNEIGAPPPTAKTIAIAGRVVINKGAQVLAQVAVENLVAPGWNIDIWGASAVALGPSFTRQLYEFLGENGFSGELILNGSKPDVLRPHPWTVSKGPLTVQYRGNYTDPQAVFQNVGVHVNFTSIDFSYGLIEYVGLEALDAGCVGVYPPHTLGAAPYEVICIENFDRPPGMTSKAPHRVRTDLVADGYIARIAERIQQACYRADDSIDRRMGVVTHNREVIRDYHAPSKFAQHLLEVSGA